MKDPQKACHSVQKNVEYIFLPHLRQEGACVFDTASVINASEEAAFSLSRTVFAPRDHWGEWPCDCMTLAIFVMCSVCAYGLKVSLLIHYVYSCFLTLSLCLPGLPLVYLRTRSTASLTNLEHQIYARGTVQPSEGLLYFPVLRTALYINFLWMGAEWGHTQFWVLWFSSGNAISS